MKEDQYAQQTRIGLVPQKVSKNSDDQSGPSLKDFMSNDANTQTIKPKAMTIGGNPTDAKAPMTKRSPDELLKDSSLFKKA